MERSSKVQTYLIFPLIIFVWAFLLRRYFMCGFVLGDDLEEFALLQMLDSQGLNWNGQLQIRFGVWLYNLLFIKLFGFSEFSMFIPTWLMSCSLSVIGYGALLSRNYRALEALAAGLFVATAPFEILSGAVRMNDLFLSWFFAMGFLSFILFGRRPVLQGFLVALFLWLGFYVKIWAVYLIPAVGLYYLIQPIRSRVWGGLISFTLTSIALHSMTAVFWKLKTGSFLPFLTKHAATYPYRELAESLTGLFMQYPRMIFVGSDLHSTLFGLVPYALIAGLFAKWLLPRFSGSPQNAPRWDSLDGVLLAYYGTFFLFLNFFPNSFKFDQYYSAPRIFRYLTPISFPMTLHLAKIILDISRAELKFSMPVPFAAALMLPLGAINLYQVFDATGPGRVYRQDRLEIIQDIRRESPPSVIFEYWAGFFVKEIYLKDIQATTESRVLYGVHSFTEYENWLKEHQGGLQEGTMLVTGWGSYVHYGAHYDGLRLNHFKDPLDPRWRLVREYKTLFYLPKPEPARLWRWTGGGAPVPKPVAVEKPKPLPAPAGEDAEKLFKQGMARFDKDDCPGAMPYYRKILDKQPGHPLAPDAQYFYAICHFRKGDWDGTIFEFKRLIEVYPKSNWVAGGHFHMGLSYQHLRQFERARAEFKHVIEHFPNDASLVNLSKNQLAELPPEPSGGPLGWIKNWFVKKKE